MSENGLVVLTGEIIQYRGNSGYVAQTPGYSNYFGSKLTVIVVSASTATPLSFSGFQRHCLTASRTAVARIGWPSRTLTLEGFPFLSISASTDTIPKRCFASGEIVGRTIFNTFIVGGVQMIRGEWLVLCCPKRAARPLPRREACTFEECTSLVQTPKTGGLFPSFQKFGPQQQGIDS